jgi:AbrB family looped-hinge helix DNA binding protein
MKAREKDQRMATFSRSSKTPIVTPAVKNIIENIQGCLLVFKMPTKTIGPKGQVVIPKGIREALGLKPGVRVIIERRGEEILISKPKIEGSYTEYFTATRSPKLKGPVHIKKIMTEEVAQRSVRQLE